jgi:putative hydrolase of the HAD superfamily
MKDTQTKNKKVILFDVYQTLIDIDINEEHRNINQTAAWKHIAKSLEIYGVNTSSSELIELNKHQEENFYTGKDKKIEHANFCNILGSILKDNFNIEISKETVCSLIYEYHKIARGYVHLYPSVAETLIRLKETYTLSVASYTQGCFTKSELIELGINTYFSYFIYTSDIGFHKRSPTFYEKCLEITGVTPENCLMVGDNYDVDVLIPQQLGIKTIWIKNPLTAHQYTHLFDHEPKNMIRITEFAKLPELIEGIFN